MRMSREDRELRDKIVVWLSTTDPSINHVNQRRKHQATTGEWFVQGKELKQWLKMPNALLWLHGTCKLGFQTVKSMLTVPKLAVARQY